MTPQEIAELIQEKARLETENQQLKTGQSTIVQALELAKEKQIEAEEKATYYAEAYDQLIDSYLQAQRDRFGKKSERFVDDQLAGEQQLLFGSDKSKPDSPPEPEDEFEDIAYTRKKSNSKKPDLDKIETKEVIIEVPEQDRVCGCGKDKEVIGYDERSRLNFVPSHFERLIEKRERRACRYCQNTAPVLAVRPHVLPKCQATESLLAHIVVSKILDRQPLYHLEKKFEQRYHWRIARQTMARWMIQLSETLQPLVNLMKDTLIDYDVAAIDATTLQVLNEPNRSPETKSHIYCIRGGPPGKPVAIYEYNAYDHKHFVKDAFAGFKGVIHADASNVCDLLAENPAVRLSYCHAHARRYFEKIYKSTKRKPGLAKHAMKLYQSLYKVERIARENDYSPDQRYALRQQESKPILDAFKAWLDSHHPKVLPRSPIGKAIQYCLNHWPELTTYLSDGRLEIDNNATERAIKPFVIARKNFMFACTMSGADALGIHFSLVLSAKALGLDPYLYYKYVLERIPFCKSFYDYSLLLPWNVNLNS